MVDLLESIWLKEHLRKATPYMLRNDGVLLECGDMHPYIIYDISYPDLADSITYTIGKRRDMLKWFYDNTQYEDTRKDIESFLKSISRDYSNELDKQWVEDNFDISSSTPYSYNDYDYIPLYEEINNETNQEFLRVRTSAMKFGGDNGDLYCRISSNNFNWYPLISELVMKNDKFVETITITTDSQSKGGRVKFYKINGKPIDHMSVEDFIMAKGNPVLEKYRTDLMNEAVTCLNKGRDLNYVFSGLHPRYINEYYRHLDRDWIKNNYE